MEWAFDTEQVDLTIYLVDGVWQAVWDLWNVASSSIISSIQLDVVIHACHHDIQDTETGGLLGLKPATSL